MMGAGFLKQVIASSLPRFSCLLLLVGVSLAGCATPSAPFAPQAEAAAELDFDFAHNQIYLPVTIRGQGPFYFLLDTGADPSAIDLDLAQQLGLSVEIDAPDEAAGAGSGSVSVFPATIAGLSFGDLPVDDFPAVAIELSRFSQRIGVPLHGILGHSFLKNRRVQIDYPARRVRIYQSGEKEDLDPGNNAFRLPLAFRENDIIPLVEVRINGIPAPVSLDTGSSQVLEIFVSQLQRLQLEPTFGSAATIELMGARGPFEARTAVIDRIELGPFLFCKPAVTFSQRTEAGEKGRSGNLGNAFLRSFVLTLDYVNEEIMFQRSKTEPEQC